MSSTSSATFDVRPLYQRRLLPYLKIPLIFGLWAGFGVIAWHSTSVWLTVTCYLAMGYFLMAIATVLHECTHNALFPRPWANWAFGIFGFFTMLVPFTAYRDDHLLHHRNNRTPKDTAAFTMGKRRPLDFLIFYTYCFGGIVVLVVYFTFVHPFLYLKGKYFALHWLEVIAHVAAYSLFFYWAAGAGVLDKATSVFIWPLLIFSLLNSVRFLAEHHGTPWEAGQLAGTRTVLTNPINTFFWNNINYHIGHHIYPSVPWYNLKELHELLLPRIEAEGALVEKGYFVVSMRAVIQGPETPERVQEQLRRKREKAQRKPLSNLVGLESSV